MCQQAPSRSQVDSVSIWQQSPSQTRADFFLICQQRTTTHQVAAKTRMSTSWTFFTCILGANHTETTTPTHTHHTHTKRHRKISQTSTQSRHTQDTNTENTEKPHSTHKRQKKPTHRFTVDQQSTIQGAKGQKTTGSQTKTNWEHKNTPAHNQKGEDRPCRPDVLQPKLVLRVKVHLLSVNARLDTWHEVFSKGNCRSPKKSTHEKSITVLEIKARDQLL